MAHAGIITCQPSCKIQILLSNLLHFIKSLSDSPNQNIHMGRSYKVVIVSKMGKRQIAESSYCCYCCLKSQWWNWRSLLACEKSMNKAWRIRKVGSSLVRLDINFSRNIRLTINKLNRKSENRCFSMFMFCVCICACAKIRGKTISDRNHFESCFGGVVKWNAVCHSV